MWIMRIIRWKWRYPGQLQLEVVIQKVASPAMSLRGSQTKPQVQSHRIHGAGIYANMKGVY